jgi:CRISPR type IV-associated protein Csf2
MQPKIIKIESLYTTLAPLHITSGETNLSAESDGFERVVSKGTVPLTRQTRIRVAARGEENRHPEIPFIAGNGWRGKIRRHCRDVLFKLVRDKKEQLDAEMILIYSCLAASSQPNASTSPSRHQEAYDHIFAGLWGGGPQLFRSHIRTSPAYVICQETLDRDLVNPDFADRAVNLQGILQFIHFRRGDDLLEFKDVNLPETIKNYPESVVEWFQKLQGTNEKRKEQREEKAAEKKAKKAGEKVVKPEVEKEKVSKIDLRSWNAREVVIPGVTFHQNTEIDATLTGLKSVGLYLWALRSFLENPFIGSESRNGLGRVKLESFIHHDGKRWPIFVQDNSGEIDFNTECELIADALGAYAEVEPEINAEMLSHVYRAKETTEKE